MRVHDNGSLFGVSVSKADVETFAAQWPCFGPRQAMWFQFDKRNGDLVDITGDPCQLCDGAGVSALADDAKAYGINKLKLSI